MNEGDEGNVFEGDELNELVCYDWMNDGLEGANFTYDIFGGNEDDNAGPGEVGGNERNNSTHEVEGNGGNNAQPEVGNNAQPAMGIDRIKVRQYAPSTTRPNQPDV